MSYPILNLAKLTMSIASLCFCSASAFAMTALDDSELSEKSGQALLNLSTIMPGEQGNVNGNTGFYKVGLQAQLDLNANIRKLQLGCGGINGADGCDIDIDYLRFAGLGSINANGTPVPDGAPGTDFNLLNPYVEFAFSDPDSLVNRKLVGLRVGSEQTRGVLSVGTRPTDAAGNAVSSTITLDGVDQEDVTKHTGINSLTGSIGELLVTGVAVVDLDLNFTNVRADISGRADGDANAAPATFDNVTLSRASELRLSPLEINDVEVQLLLGTPVDVEADYVSALKLIHNLKISNNGGFAKGFYISLSEMGDNLVDVKSNGNKTITRQAEAAGVVGADDTVINAPTNSTNWLKWQTEDSNGNTTWTPAQRGWSLRVPRVEITNFETQPIEAQAIGGLFAKAIVNNPDLGQVPIDNCFGGLSFC